MTGAKFNPLFLFTEPLLESFIKSGKLFFVRNGYNRGSDNNRLPLRSFLMTHYDDLSKAKAHFNSITTDKYCFLYNWEDKEHQNKLKIASQQPSGLKIFSGLFLPDWKSKITAQTKEKINQYMYQNTNWKPGKGDKTNLNFYFQFGQLYFTLTYKGNKISGKFDDIDL